MSRIRDSLVFLFSFLVCPGQLPMQYRLEVIKTVESPEGIRGLFMPAKCDREGNLYFRSLDGQPARAAVRTLKKVGPDGKLKAKYTFEGQPELANLDAYDFAVSPDGRVFATAAGPEQVYLVEFREEGMFKSKTLLDHLFRPTQITAFKSGDSFLISGVELNDGSEQKGFPAFTAIFDRAGRTVRNLSRQTRDEETAKDEESAREEEPELAGINTGVEFGIALTGEDGFAYLLRQTIPAVIYVVSPAGEVVRKLEVNPGRRYLKLLPHAMQLAEGRLLLMFGNESERIFQVVDPQSGEILEEYFPEPALGGALACYNGKELVFLTSNNGKLQLTYAQRGSISPPR